VATPWGTRLQRVDVQPPNPRFAEMFADIEIYRLL
jgi:hypothetical protein